MLAKGLDFDNVSLGMPIICYIIQILGFERSFQMMTQVSGRSGRSENKEGNYSNVQSGSIRYSR
jgi:primosomal protein N' (replication factor Y)